jgi:hypothetical protein
MSTSHVTITIVSVNQVAELEGFYAVYVDKRSGFGDGEWATFMKAVVKNARTVNANASPASSSSSSSSS